MNHRVWYKAATAFFMTGWQVALAADIQLDLPEQSKAVLQLTEPLSSYTLPTGPFRDGEVPGKTIEGRITKTAWQTDAPIRNTMDILAPLRDQLEKEGFVVTFSCESFECGGFDFRYATPVLPEPEMHVDLADYRYLTAERGGDAVTLLISRSSTAGFVQVIEAYANSGEKTGASLAQPKTELGEIPADQARLSTAPLMPASGPNAQNGFFASGSKILEGLEFPSGSASLAAQVYPSLDELAIWLKANPKLKVAVVGHTDASGGLDVNIAISKKRALSVRQYLLDKHGISASQVEAEGAGYLAPIASNLTEEGRRANRRVEVMVTSTQFQP